MRPRSSHEAGGDFNSDHRNPELCTTKVPCGGACTESAPGSLALVVSQAMDTDSYLASIEHDAASMLAVATAVPLDTPVPTCPGWTLWDLIEHTGIVHRHKTETVRGGWFDESPPRPSGPDGDIVEWFGNGVVEMLEVLRTADLSKPTWTWCPHQHNADWWVRRMAHETVIHGADALITAGRSGKVGHELGIDGVDEILDEMMIGGPAWGTLTAGEGVVALEADGHRWVVRRASFSGTSPNSGNTYEDLPALVYAKGHEPDAVIAADPGTLDLWLWGRGDLPGGAVSGDESLVDYVRLVAAEATQ
jgi:uncharacterized protein (TIGR03083 family)